MSDAVKKENQEPNRIKVPIKLSIPDFFLHLGIIFGILDSFRSLNEYLSTPNVPIISISFAITVIFIYGFVGFLWSLPVRIPVWFQKKRGNEVNPEKQVACASVLLLPVLLLLVILILFGWLLIFPTSFIGIVKIGVGILVVAIYGWFLYSGSKLFFRKLYNSSLPLWSVVFSEIAICILAYMIIVGINGVPSILNFLVAIILIVLTWFLIRGRFSPIGNPIARNSFRVIAIALIILPFILNAFHSEKSQGVKTIDGNGSIILISIDALRTDYLSIYGSNWTKTPNIDAFSKDATVFGKMYSIAPWTMPSMASLATGVYPSVHGANVKTYRIQEGIPTLAESLRERGYTTAAFFINPLMGIASRLDNGFDEYYESYSMTGPYPCLYPGTFYHHLIFIPLCMRRIIHYDSVYDERMESRLFPWIEKNKDKKVFLWVHYYDPHAPYGPPDRYLKRENPQGNGKLGFVEYHLLMDILPGTLKMPEKTMNCLKDLYAGDIDFADERVGMLLDKLKEVGWMNGATVIITADHGEEFYEHGSFEHGHTFYEELMHLPLIVHVGGGVEPIPEGREKEPVSMLDLTATIADIAGLETLPFYSALQGKSVCQKTDEYRSSSPIFMESTDRGFPNRIAVLKNGWKYHIHEDGTIREIYNLETDPLELRNLIGTIPDDALQVIYEDVKNWEETNSVLKRKLRTNPDAEDEEAKLNLRLIQGLGYFK